MNDQSQMMMNLSKMNQPQRMNQAPQMMNPPQMMNQQPQPPMNHSSQIMMNQTQPQMMNRGGYNKFWSQQQHHMDPNMKFKNPMQPNFVKPGRSNNWKGKKVNDKRKDSRRIMEKPNPSGSLTVPFPNNNIVVGGGGYQPPTLHELQSQNRLKARKFYPKKKFNNRFAPYAPRNTTSFLIRAKKSGGIASLVSPCPVTPAVLPTPILSPSREVLGDMAKEEWGVDGYGSMKGLIRLRSPGHDADGHEDEDEEDGGGGSSESDVEEHVEVERRLDHDLSRFEMIYPNNGGDYNNGLENRVDDQDSHIAQLEEENLTLKERLFLMEREFSDLQRRLLFLEKQNQIVEDVNEEVVKNWSDNESEGGSDVPVMGIENNVEMVHSMLGSVRNGNFEVKTEVENDAVSEAEGVGDVCMEESVPDESVTKKDEVKVNEMKEDEFVINDVKEAKDEEAMQRFLPDEVLAKDNDVLDKNVSGEFEMQDRNDEPVALEAKNVSVNDIVFTEKNECKDQVVGTSLEAFGDDDSSVPR
ncbi:hypothetical protein TanjilG_30432 [Lupinus angustifolius]|uniref:Similar to PRLI-interacting factor A n=1 Tax=Lupinus angustifolius TaxID=3871 RepID=A0A0D6DQE8_LUPAN|nr:PREDICTED: uncharacterized protein LOC109336350 [Lupinus angustifolius]OIV91210.1 hypothetical protein TanjilG_30432 [Lupinus angustifolius]CCW03268.1 similar to PRLI-interacting factor A [Lupinus angustifolius]